MAVTGTGIVIAAVGVAAIKYTDLSNDRIKDYAVRLVRATREPEEVGAASKGHIRFGASPRVAWTRSSTRTAPPIWG